MSRRRRPTTPAPSKAACCSRWPRPSPSSPAFCLRLAVLVRLPCCHAEPATHTHRRLHAAGSAGERLVPSRELMLLPACRASSPDLAATARSAVARSRNRYVNSDLVLYFPVLDFAIQVLRKGAAADDIISPLVIFSVQYIMVNHMNWKHKKYSRWKTTLRHSYRSKYHGLKDIEDVQLVLCDGLDIIYYILSNLLEDFLPNPPFVTMVLSSSLKPFSLITALTSLLSFRNSDIQVAAARALSVLCFVVCKAQPQMTENASFTGDVSEIRRLEASIYCILDEEEKTNDCLVVAVFNLLTSAARYQPAFLTSLIEQSVKSTDHNTSASNQTNGCSGHTSKRNARLVDQILDYVVRSIELMNRYQCQGKIFEIMSYELFLQGKLLPETSNPALEGTKGQKEHSSAPCRSSVVFKWFDTAILDDLINHLSSNAYKKELLYHAKVAACLCTVHLITKLSTGNTGSLSFSVMKKIQIISTKLLQHHAIAALLSQYSLHGYRGEQDLNNLIINDLYYHILGELEGRQISSGPFQELLSFLLEFKLFEHDPSEQLQKTFPVANANFLFNIEHIHDELGVDFWTNSDWKLSKEIAEKMLDIMREANLMKCYADAKLSTLRSFLTFLSVYTGVFLCSQAKEALKRAEELQFLDLAHFPELPMPDILHGLQDQVVSIVTELFEANGSNTLNSETERVCHLLLVTLEMSLYMELCVSQSCGIRPVLGRFEDFCKGTKSMLQAIEKHNSFKPLVRSLTQITTLLYPGLGQTNFVI
nr:unnamed protein product [Digitaria exilis]